MVGVSSIVRLILSSTVLVRMLPTLDLNCEENGQFPDESGKNKVVQLDTHSGDDRWY